MPGKLKERDTKHMKKKIDYIGVKTGKTNIQD